jgi:hypothetical protein
MSNDPQRQVSFHREPQPGAPRAAHRAPNRLTVLVAMLAGFALALALWGGHLHGVAGGLSTPSAALGDSANSQPARSVAKAAPASLASCTHQLPLSRHARASSSVGCTPAHGGRESSAGASAP